MGKQTAVALTPVDEREFLTFLRSSAEIRLLNSSGPTIESLWVDSFDSIEGFAMFYIWNTSFAWTPKFGTVTADPSGECNGHRFVRNTATAPLIEYSRHVFNEPNGAYGRVYWCKSFAETPAYDHGAFDKWYAATVRWLRKHGTQTRRGAFNTYYLPDAWAKYGRSIQQSEGV